MEHLRQKLIVGLIYFIRWVGFMRLLITSMLFSMYLPFTSSMSRENNAYVHQSLISLITHIKHCLHCAVLIKRSVSFNRFDIIYVKLKCKFITFDLI